MTIVIDLDNTLTLENIDKLPYQDVAPNEKIIAKIREYKSQGFEIIIHTSRNMRTYQKDISKINAHTLPVIIDWLDKHQVPYDGIVVGKPWCGHNGFYVDDRCIRPSEFLSKSLDEISSLLEKEKDIINSNEGK